MSHRPYGPRIEPTTLPLLEEQIATLNCALTAEVLRHAETRLRLQRMEAWCQFLEAFGEEENDA